MDTPHYQGGAEPATPGLPDYMFKEALGRAPDEALRARLPGLSEATLRASESLGVDPAIHTARQWQSVSRGPPAGWPLPLAQSQSPSVSLLRARASWGSPSPRRTERSARSTRRPRSANPALRATP